MKHRLGIISGLTVVLVFLALAMRASAAPAAQGSVSAAGGSATLTVSTIATEQEQAAAMRFWTHERLAAAKPMPMPVQTGPVAVDQASLQNPVAAGPAGRSAPGAPAPDADRIARLAYAADWASGGKAGAELADMPAIADGTSELYTSYIVNQDTAIWKTDAHRAIGRLSFVTPNGTAYCSASVISPNNIIVTAAHCLYDTTNNTWYSSMAFTPAYRNGNAPYGTFPFTQCRVLGAYSSLSGSYNLLTWTPYDVALCIMGRNSAGWPLSAATGWFGRQWNFPYVEQSTTLGYPWNDYRNAALTDAGKYLRLCHSETFQQASEIRGGGCNWGSGMNGGPWVVKYNPFGSGLVDSINSGLINGTKNLYGPLFNGNNIVPLCVAMGC